MTPTHTMTPNYIEGIGIALILGAMGWAMWQSDKER